MKNKTKEEEENAFLFDVYKLVEACKLLLIQVKQGEIEIFPKENNTPDYLQQIETAIKKIEADEN